MKDRNAECARLYSAGVPTAEIGRRLHMSPGNVGKVAWAQGCPKRGKGGPRPHRLTMAKIEQRRTVLCMHREGASRAEIKKATGLGNTTITRWVREAGQTRRNGHAEADRSEALAMYAKGVKLEAIRRWTGLSPATVLRWARRLGVKRGSRDPRGRMKGAR